MRARDAAGEGVTYLVAGLCAMAVAGALMRWHGAAPLTVYRLLIGGTWGNAYGLGQVLYKFTTLLVLGLSVAVAQRGGLMSIGAEGQVTVGAFAMAMLGAALPAGTPAPVALPLVLLIGALGGAAVGVIPGLIKWRSGASEVITTLLLNFTIRGLMLGVGARVFLRESMHTQVVAPGAELPRAARLLAGVWPGLSGSAVNASLLLALLLCAGCAYFLRRTAAGFRLRVVGQNPEAARAAGIHLGRSYAWIMALSGALAGLGGANFVLGYKHYYEDGFASGLGFTALAVAVLGQGRPLGVLLAALLFGTLQQGGLAVNAVVPRELIDVLIALTILALAAASPTVRGWLRGLRT